MKKKKDSRIILRPTRNCLSGGSEHWLLLQRDRVRFPAPARKLTATCTRRFDTLYHWRYRACMWYMDIQRCKTLIKLSKIKTVLRKEGGSGRGEGEGGGEEDVGPEDQAQQSGQCWSERLEGRKAAIFTTGSLKGREVESGGLEWQDLELHTSLSESTRAENTEMQQEAPCVLWSFTSVSSWSPELYKKLYKDETSRRRNAPKRLSKGEQTREKGQKAGPPSWAWSSFLGHFSRVTMMAGGDPGSGPG